MAPDEEIDEDMDDDMGMDSGSKMEDHGDWVQISEEEYNQMASGARFISLASTASMLAFYATQF